MCKGMIDIPYSTAFVVGTLANRKKIEESLYYAGGISNLDTLLDIDLLIQASNLTEKQFQVLQLYYYNQLTQEEISRVMGISQQAVLDHLNKVKQKLGRVIKVWRAKDEEFDIKQICGDV